MRAVIAGTGPSLAHALPRLVDTKLPIFGCNNTYQVLKLTALLACNPEWWDYYWPRDELLSRSEFDCWTWDRPTADKYGLCYVRGEWAPGLSTDPDVIHYGHSSGYQLLNLAYHYGVREAVLVGYDLRYPAGYDGMRQVAGGDRHYFGEYPVALQHWTKYKMGPAGELNGLLEEYRTIDPAAYGLRIINCSPGSALDFFETGKLEDWT